MPTQGEYVKTRPTRFGTVLVGKLVQESVFKGHNYCDLRVEYKLGDEGMSPVTSPFMAIRRRSEVYVLSKKERRQTRGL